MSEPYFATGYIRLLYRYLCEEHDDTDALLKDAGYSASDLMGADFTMPFSAQMRVCENAVACSAPGLGLRVGNQLQLAAHGPLGTAMQTAPDLRTALETFIRFISMRASFYTLSLDESVVGDSVDNGSVGKESRLY